MAPQQIDTSLARPRLMAPRDAAARQLMAQLAVGWELRNCLPLVSDDDLARARSEWSRWSRHTADLLRRLFGSNAGEMDYTHSASRSMPADLSLEVAAPAWEAAMDDDLARPRAAVDRLGTFAEAERTTSPRPAAEPGSRLSGAAPIADAELRQRCEDLLAAGGHYDRAVREACVILESRVRAAATGAPTLVGTALMERAFGTGGPLQLSGVPPEQVGAVQLYRGTMAFFRNAAGRRPPALRTRQRITSRYGCRLAQPISVPIWSR